MQALVVSAAGFEDRRQDAAASLFQNCNVMSPIRVVRRRLRWVLREPRWALQASACARELNGEQEQPRSAWKETTTD